MKLFRMSTGGWVVTAVLLACSGDEVLPNRPSAEAEAGASSSGGVTDGSVDLAPNYDGGHSSAHDGGHTNSTVDYESLRNKDPLFRRHRTDSRAAIDALGFSSDEFTVATTQPDNGAGPGGQGQFRLACQYSHFGNNDPIVFPGQPGAAHLHMFWGNTDTTARTVFHDPSVPGDMNDILEFGGGSCQGFELNRSAYWIPALIDSSTGTPQVVIPDNIVLYYKSYRPSEVHPMPQGLQMLAGNVAAGGAPGVSFQFDDDLFWSCGENGFSRNKQASIPTNCNPNEPINASIHFPNCLAVNAQGKPVVTSADHKSHTRMVPESNACPASHPYRIPQISYLIYWPNGSNGSGAGVSSWRLSSDSTVAGGSLHGDWLGGWHKQTIENWTHGCFDPDAQFSGPRNCSNGQTGQNRLNRSLRRVSNLNDYTGPNFLPLPR
jgi:hypothetical protein